MYQNEEKFNFRNPIMSCKYDLDYLGIPIVDLSKWKSGVEDDRFDIIEDRLENIENAIQKIVDKLQNNGNNSLHDKLSDINFH